MKILVKEASDKIKMLYSIDGSINDKLTYAAKRMIDRYNKAMATIFESVEEQAQEKRIDLAMVDQDGAVILSGSGEFKYDKQSYLALQRYLKEINKEAGQKEIDIDPFTADIENPDFARIKTSFSEEEIEQLKGFFIK